MYWARNGFIFEKMEDCAHREHTQSRYTSVYVDRVLHWVTFLSHTVGTRDDIWPCIWTVYPSGPKFAPLHGRVFNRVGEESFPLCKFLIPRGHLYTSKHNICYKLSIKHIKSITQLSKHQKHNKCISKNHIYTPTFTPNSFTPLGMHSIIKSNPITSIMIINYTTTTTFNPIPKITLLEHLFVF